MKKFLVALLSVIAVFCCAFGLVACDTQSSDNTSVENGKDGVGIKTVTVNDVGELVIELTNGTIFNYGSISGKDGVNGTNGTNGTDGTNGSDGKDGINGINGKDGTDGKDGVGIKTAEVNADGELIIVLTNDKRINCGKVVGADGKDGVDGKDGEDGKDGQDGNDGKDGQNGEVKICVHTFSNWQTTVATCTSIGYKTRYCLQCDYTEYEFIAATGHNWDNGTVVFNAECIKNGLLYYNCGNCDATKTEIINATGEHVLVNGSCKYCNKGKAQLIDEYYNGNYGYEYFGKMTNGEKLQNLYSDIDNEVIKFHNSEAITETELTFDFAQYGISRDEAVTVWKTYMDDKPLYYWISKTASISDSRLIVGVENEYTDGKTRTEYNEKLYKLIDKYSAIAEGESAYSVAFAYHDLIIDTIDYAYNGRLPESAAWAHNITGVFEGKGAVCEGYARAFQLLLNMRGIDNLFVTGVSRNEDHAWNLVKLDDGNWYWYDLTWDDTPGYYWGISHTYFCALDEEFLKNHTVSASTALGADFLYELPARATEHYSGKEFKYLDSFKESDIEFLVIGYNYANVNSITSGGICVIPETVKYGNSDFIVISLARYVNGNFFEGSVLSHRVKLTSVSIPSTVRYIHQNALHSNNGTELEEIIVDEDNKFFCSVDGVLFTKSLYTLITYPSDNKRTQYTIPAETRMIADLAIDSTKLEVLKIGKNVSLVGIVNWGSGYPDHNVMGVINVITDAWHSIFNALSEGGQIVLDEDNSHFVMQGKMLFNSSLTYLYAAALDIEEAVVPETVTVMESGAFSHCKNLKSVKLPSELKRISGFSGCESLEEIVIPYGITELDSHMFWGCTSLKTVVIPDSVKKIGENTFYNCISLQNLIIPAGVTDIDKCAFANCALQNVTIADGNQNYIIRNGCLIEVTTKTLINAIDNAIIPDDGSVEIIGERAFGGCKNTEELIIPVGIITIGDYAVIGCSSLKKLVVRNTVTSIGFNWLANTYDLDIFVEYTEEQWWELDDNYQYGYAFGRTFYFYSEEKPEGKGNFWHYVDGEIVVW